MNSFRIGHRRLGRKALRDMVFVAKVEGAMDIAIDDGEIKEHAWLNPAEALAKHANGEIDPGAAYLGHALSPLSENLSR